VFVHTKGASENIELRPAEAQQLKKIARSKGVRETTILKQWIRERLHESSPLLRKTLGQTEFGRGLQVGCRCVTKPSFHSAWRFSIFRRSFPPVRFHRFRTAHRRQSCNSPEPCDGIYQTAFPIAQIIHSQ